MTISYFELCKNRRLNEVVLMGSHDAAIDGGGSNTQTQKMDIAGQANDGARFFDLRVAAFKTSTGGGKVELKSYHDATILPSPTLRIGGSMKVSDLGAKRDGVKTSTTGLGFAGFGLQAMLQQAKDFLDDNPSEFLIFKFDKSTNWDLILEVCRAELADPKYRFRGGAAPGERNLNTKTLDELQGTLLILFPGSAFTQFPNPNALHAEGYLKWRNLYDKHANAPAGYVDDFPGLQYYGKGGTSAKGKGDSGKVAMNAQAQTALMHGHGSYKTAMPGWRGRLGMTQSGQHAGADPEAIGLMYWTTTGLSRRGIEARNKKMWSTDRNNVRGQMVDLGIQHADPSVGGAGNGVAGNLLKAFMPNIIMVDFVDGSKGNTIYGMNFDSGAVISQELMNMDSAEG